MWDLTVPGDDDHDFYVEADAILPFTRTESTAYAGISSTQVLVHNRCPSAGASQSDPVDPQSAPGGKNGAPVSIKNLKMTLGRAGMSVSQYDIEHEPELTGVGGETGPESRF